MKRSYLDCSTAHVTKSEGTNLGWAPVVSYPYEYGAWLAVPSRQDEDDADWTGWEALHQIVRYARRHRCLWIKLDADGDHIESLPRYEW